MSPRLLAVVLLAGCAVAPTTPADQPPDPTQATAHEGRFEVTFAIARTTLRSGDAIDGVATLRLLEAGPGALSGSGTGMFAFAFHEVGGAGRGIDPASTADCVPYRIAVDQPITSPITKSGGYSGDEPDAEFKRSFLEGTTVRLPVGTWDITARAGFIDGANCQGESHAIEATVRVTVTA